MAEDPKNPVTDPEQKGKQTPQEPTTYTQAQLDSEADKRTAKAIETAKNKWQEEQAKALEDAKSEVLGWLR